MVKDAMSPIQSAFLHHRSAEERQTIDIFEPIDVDIRNFAGDVVITGHHGEQGARQGSLTLVRRAVHGIGRADDSEASLSDIALRTDLTEIEPGHFLLTVESTTSHSEPWFQRLDIEIDIAQLGAVRVHTARGHVVVRGADRGCDIETTDGDCRFITRRVIHDPMTIATSAGDIEVRLPTGSTGSFDAETVGGQVFSSIKTGRWLLRDQRNDGNSMVATLNAGTNRILLRTTDESIYISVSDRPDTSFSIISDL